MGNDEGGIELAVKLAEDVEGSMDERELWAWATSAHIGRCAGVSVCIGFLAQCESSWDDQNYKNKWNIKYVYHA
jgi:hypothetical protein